MDNGGVILILLFLAYWLDQYECKPPTRIDRLFSCVPFFLMGYMLKSSPLYSWKYAKLIKLIIAIASGMCFIYAICQQGFYLALHNNDWGPNFVACFIGATMGTLSTLLICQLISCLPNICFLGSGLRYIAKNGISILPIHWWVYYMTIKIYPTCSIYQSTIIVVIFTIILTELYKKLSIKL